MTTIELQPGFREQVFPVRDHRLFLLHRAQVLSVVVGRLSLSFKLAGAPMGRCVHFLPRTQVPEVARLRRVVRLGQHMGDLLQDLLQWAPLVFRQRLPGYASPMIVVNGMTFPLLRP